MTSLPIFAINLDRAPERLAQLGARLDAQGLAFERVAAVDARKLSRADIARHVDGVGYWGRLTPSEVACFLSHRKCWKTIVEHGVSHAAVLEDDVVPGAAAGEVLSRADWVPPAADLVKLETSLKPVWLACQRAARRGAHSVRRLYSSHDCAAAYVVTRSAARWLVAETERFRDEVDEVLFTERSSLNRSMRVYQMEPALFLQKHRFDDAGSVGDPGSFIKDREGKVTPKRSLVVRLARMCAQGRRDLVQSVMVSLGRRHTDVVDFR
jgi:glycosyl transferase family 25